MSGAPNSYRQVLVVGAGAIAVDHHLPRLRALPGLERIDLFDLSPARRQELDQRFSGDGFVRVRGDLPSEPVDLAVIATPPAFHLEGLQQLADRCRFFVVEKPAAPTAEAALAMQAAADAAGARAVVHLVRRELAALPLVRTFYRSGAFGPLLKVTAAEGHIFDWPAASAAAFSRRQSGGGVLLDMGSHLVDQFFQIFDRLAVEKAWIDSTGDGVEANCTLDLRGDGDVPVTAVLSRNRSLSNRIAFHFESAVVSAVSVGRHLSVEVRGGPSFEACPFGERGVATLGEMMNSFYRRRVLEGDDEGVTPAAAARSLQVIQDAYAAARPMERVF